MGEVGGKCGVMGPAWQNIYLRLFDILGESGVGNLGRSGGNLGRRGGGIVMSLSVCLF